MKTQIEKIIYDGQKFTNLGDHYSSLDIAHSQHDYFDHQQTFEDIDAMSSDIPYLHLIEYRDGEHNNDLYFTTMEFPEKG